MYTYLVLKKNQKQPPTWMQRTMLIRTLNNLRSTRADEEVPKEEEIYISEPKHILPRVEEKRSNKENESSRRINRMPNTTFQETL